MEVSCVNDVPPWVILSILGVASALSRSARSVSTEIRMIFGRCFVDCWPEHGSPARNIQAAMTVASATRNQTIHPSILSPTPQTSRLRFSAIFLENEAPEEAQEGLFALFAHFWHFFAEPPETLTLPGTGVGGISILRCGIPPPKLLNPDSARMKARIKPVAQAIPQQVQTQGCERDRGARKKREVSSDTEKVAAVRHHGSPLRQWRLSAESQKAEPGRRQHHIACGERSLYQNRRRGISQDVMEQNAPRSRPESSSSLNVLYLFE